MSNKYVTIEDLATVIEFEPSGEAQASYQMAVEKADEAIAKALTSGSGKRFGGMPLEDLDPPSYLPMQPREAPRIPDLCPDETEECTRCIGSGETAFDTCGQCAGTGRMAPKLPELPHNPETCRDPACDCYPF